MLRGVAGLSIGLLTLGLSEGPASGQSDDFISGSGIAYGQVVRVGPTASGISLAPVVGVSLADYIGTVGRGEAKAIEWAAIGVVEETLVDMTPTLLVTSTQEGSAEGVTRIAGQDADSPVGGPLELYGRADPAPMGESRIKLATLRVPGVVEIDGGVAHTTSGVVSTAEGMIRRSTATVEISRLDLAGGLVSLRGLRWSAEQTTNADGEPSFSGGFTIDRAQIDPLGDLPILGGGLFPIPVQTDDMEALVSVVNTTLAPTGLSIVLPTFRTPGGQTEVTSLGLRVANSPVGNQLLAPLLEALHPIREPVTDALIELAQQISDETDTTDLTVAILAADVVVGILSGASQFHLQFGGVRAFTEGEDIGDVFAFEEFDLGAPADPGPITTPGTPGSPGTPGTPGSEETQLVAAPGPTQRTVPGDRGGIAVIVGLIGLGVALLLAGADWYRMRISRRAVASA